MTGLFIFLAVVCWMLCVFIGSNNSVAAKTGLLKSRYRHEYHNQNYTYESLEKIFNSITVSISNKEFFKAPFGLKLKFYLLLINSERICTDFLLVSGYYLKNFQTKDIRINLDYNTANEIHAVLNMVMAHERVFRKVFNQPTHSSQEELITRFLVLKRVCLMNNIHSIEWMFIEPVIRHASEDKRQWRRGNTNGIEALSRLLNEELSYLGQDRLREGLAIAMKAIFFTHPVYRDKLRSSILNKAATLKTNKFKETMLFGLLVGNFTLFDVARFNFEEVAGLHLSRDIKEFKPLIFDCGNYLITPLMSRKNAGIYTRLPISLLTTLTTLNVLGCDTNSWVVDYFLTHDTGYIVWDTLNPGLESEKRKVNLGKETWEEDLKVIHSHFKHCMDEVFNVCSR